MIVSESNSMLTRVVKMNFRSEEVETFKAIFGEIREQIRHFDGCMYLELFQQHNRPELFFTYSVWKSETHLEAYRHSELFQTTWSRTRALFAEKAEAWTLDSLIRLP